MPSRILADLAEVLTGASPDRKLSGDPVFFIQIKDLDASKRALVSGAKPRSKRATPVRPGDVLLAARGGQAIMIAEQDDLVGGYPTLDVYLIRPNAKRLDPGYLTAWLTFEPVRNQLQASTTGALIPRIPIGSLKDLSVPLPPLARQRTLGRLLQSSRQEAELMDRLAVQTRQLRERQIATAFASLEP